MKALKRIAAGLGAALSVAIVLSLLTPVSATAGGTSSGCWNVRPKERGFARKMNAVRTNNSMGKLRLDPELSKAARVHTRTMVQKNYLHHTPTETLKKRVTRWDVLGENVGVGGTVDSLHEAFMNSPAHRDNILYGQFRYVGIGTRVVDGRLWVTVIFEAATNPGTTLKMPSC